MIRPEVWQLAIRSVLDDAAISLSTHCDKTIVATVLDDLVDEGPPKVNDMGNPYLTAKVQIVRRLQDEVTSEPIQAWLDVFAIELASPNPFDE